MVDLKMIGIFEKGNAEKERIVFTAQKNCNTGDYSVHIVDTDGESISLRPKFTHVMPPINLQAGDTLVIYTKQGTEFINDPENKVYGFFLGNPIEDKTMILLCKMTDMLAFHPAMIELDKEGKQVNPPQAGNYEDKTEECQFPKACDCKKCNEVEKAVEAVE